MTADKPYAEPEESGLPPSNLELDLPRTAIRFMANAVWTTDEVVAKLKQ